MILLRFRFSNPALRTSNFSNSYMALTELEEMRVESILGYRPSSLDDFLLAPIHPPLIALYGPSINIRGGLLTS
jgi:hypothetical protein